MLLSEHLCFGAAICVARQTNTQLQVLQSHDCVRFREFTALHDERLKDLGDIFAPRKQLEPLSRLITKQPGGFFFLFEPEPVLSGRQVNSPPPHFTLDDVGRLPYHIAAL